MERVHVLLLKLVVKQSLAAANNGRDKKRDGSSRPLRQREALIHQRTSPLQLIIYLSSHRRTGQSFQSSVDRSRYKWA